MALGYQRKCRRKCNRSLKSAKRTKNKILKYELNSNSKLVHPIRRMTAPQTAFFMLFLFSILLLFSGFLEQLKMRAATVEMTEFSLTSGPRRSSKHSYASKAAQRAATNSRPFRKKQAKKKLRKSAPQKHPKTKRFTKKHNIYQSNSNN